MTRMVENTYYKVIGKIDTLAETPKAIKVKIVSIGGNAIGRAFQSTWFPKSQIKNIEYGEEGMEEDPLDSFEATEWILNTKGYGVDIEQSDARPVIDTDARTARLPTQAKEFKPTGLDNLNDLDDDIPF